MVFASSTRAAENRTRWKGIVANSSVVLRRPSKVMGQNRIDRPLEILSILKAIRTNFKGSDDKQDLTFMVITYEMTNCVRSSIYCDCTEMCSHKIQCDRVTFLHLSSDMLLNSNSLEILMMDMPWQALQSPFRAKFMRQSSQRHQI